MASRVAGVVTDIQIGDVRGVERHALHQMVNFNRNRRGKTERVAVVIIALFGKDERVVIPVKPVFAGMFLGEF